MMLRLLTLITGAIMLSGCSSTKVDYYKDSSPKMDVKEYFNGPIKAWGVVQDWRGRVVSQFDVKMVGKWQDDTGTLEEDFVYYGTGKTQKRIWTIKKIANNHYEGTASDIVDKASGHQSGSAMNWKYVMDLEVEGGTYRVKFDDWMWQMNDGVLINRSYIKKFGFTVAELTIFMKKGE